jgi:signal transduction histidine kinase
MANLAYLALFNGRSIVDMPLREAVPELEGQPFLGLLDQVRGSGAPYVGTEVTARIDHTNSGVVEDRIFNFVLHPIREEDGGVETVLVFAYDVTDAVLARRRVESLMEALQDADRRKDEFLAMLAHELRNPLAPVRNAVTLLQGRSPSDDPETRELLAVLDRQTGNLGRLVNDLLDVSRITRGLIEIERTVIDLRAIVDRATQSVRPLMDGRRHEVTLSSPARPVLVHGDPVRLEQVLVNLLTNACKYTDPGGHILVELGDRDGAAQVLVRDDGIGIEQATIARVFDLFSQAERALDRSQGGLGIGLTVAQRLVEMHGGTIQARSEGAGRGAEFLVTLPLVPDAALKPALAPARLQAGAHARAVLVVDDNVDAARTLACLLQAMGHRVEVAHDGPDALQAALRAPPDVVLLDIGLPGMDGFEVARSLREGAGTRHARIVAVTGYGQLADRQRAELAGFDRLVVKPVALEVLQQVLV